MEKSPGFWLGSSLLRELLEAGVLQPEACWKTLPRVQSSAFSPAPTQRHPPVQSEWREPVGQIGVGVSWLFPFKGRLSSHAVGRLL